MKTTTIKFDPITTLLGSELLNVTDGDSCTKQSCCVTHADMIKLCLDFFRELKDLDNPYVRTFVNNLKSRLETLLHELTGYNTNDRPFYWDIDLF